MDNNIFMYHVLELLQSHYIDNTFYMIKIIYVYIQISNNNNKVIYIFLLVYYYVYISWKIYEKLFYFKIGFN